MNWDIFTSNEKETQFLDEKIVAFNRMHAPFTQKIDFVSLNFHIKNEIGVVIAGINSLIYCWGMLYIDVLFVEEGHRGQQLATLSHLDTFDWQAKDFYIKAGYEIFGILEDCPPGHKRYYMKKNLL